VCKNRNWANKKKDALPTNWLVAGKAVATFSIAKQYS
jgi:hypothetical protein